MTEGIQLFDALPPHIEAALRASIERFGVLVPVVVDQSSRILDGHHRSRMAAELGVDCPQIVRHVSDEDEARAIAVTLNADRRQLDAEQRREIVAVLREQGHSIRAIGGALGVDARTVQRDLATVAGATVPDYVIGLDGKSRPSRRPNPAETMADAYNDVRLIDSVDDEGEELVVHGANGDALIVPAPEEDDDRPARPAVTKPDLGGGISHPARYSEPLIPVFAEIIADNYGTDPVDILDPFAGTGKIHRLNDMHDYWNTVGIELEPEWAHLHPRTQVGNALALPFADCSFDVICTSPTYGNRLADKHHAADAHLRRSYTHDLGRQLSDDNSGGMQWGAGYRDFHIEAWEEAARVLRPGGLFILNIKDHVRDGQLQYVPQWHVSVLARVLGADLLTEWSRPVAVRSLKAGTNAELRVEHEDVLSLIHI